MSNNTPIAVGGYPGIIDAMVNSQQTSQSSNPLELAQLTLTTLQTLLAIVQNAAGEQSQPIPFWQPANSFGTNNILVPQVIDVPFVYNSLIVSCVGGVVNVSEGDVSVQLSQMYQTFANNAFPDPLFLYPAQPTWSWAFGSYAFVDDSSTANNGTRIDIFTGPQEIRFSKRQPGKLTLWPSLFNYQPGSINVDPPAMQYSGQIQYIP